MNHRIPALLFASLGVLSCSGGDDSGPTGLESVVPTKLRFDTRPSTTRAFEQFSPTVQVSLIAADGTPALSSTSLISLRLAPDANTGTLMGTTTVSAVSGLATFSDLTVDAPGVGYRLIASSDGLQSDTSGVFDGVGVNAPRLRQPSATVILVNDATICPTTPIATSFAVSMEFDDPDGDVADGTTTNVEWTFTPSGSQGDFQTASLRSGSGSDGELLTIHCYFFRTDESVEVTVWITDGQGNESNAPSVTISKPAGSN